MMRSEVMKIAEYLKTYDRPALTVKSNETVGYFAQKIRQHRAGAMVVSDDGRAVLGIMSERDIIYGLADRRGELRLLPVSALMTRRVVSCSSEDQISTVMNLMVTHRIRHVPVTDNNTLVGMIDVLDLIAYRLDQIEKKAKLVTLLQDLDE
jgi:CBS domain-containing protein